MPKLDTFTAHGRPAEVNVGAVSPESFGAQAGDGLTHFGRTVQDLSDRLQRQKDDLDIVDRAAYFDQKLADQYRDVMNDDSLKGATVQETMTNRVNALKQFSREHDEGIGETQTRTILASDGSAEQTEIPPASAVVQRALRQHIIQKATSHIIEMQSDVLKEEARQQASDLEQTVNQHVDQAVLQPWNEGNHLGQMQEMLQRAKYNKIIPAEFIHQVGTKATDRFWRQVSSAQPARMMQIQAEYLSQGKAPAGMDQARIMEYGNIAVGRLNARDKQDQADIKDLQDKNHARLTAQSIRGGMDRAELADIVDRRGVDPDKAMSLINLNDAIKQKQKEENFVDGRTPQIETRLMAMKYSQTTTPAKVEAFRQQIFNERMQDHISQRDFEHLNSIWQGVSDQVNKEDTTGQSAAVTHAHEVLNRTLQVTGPMGFDSLGNQTQASATLDFYREVERDPKANPMDIAEKVIKRYKPIIEQRIKLGETDQAKLDTSKMDGLAARGAISKASVQEWRDAQQQKAGQKIVDETLQNLPPPTEPSWLDTIMEKIRGGSTKTDAPKPQSATPKMRK